MHRKISTNNAELTCLCVYVCSYVRIHEVDIIARGGWMDEACVNGENSCEKLQATLKSNIDFQHINWLSRKSLLDKAQHHLGFGTTTTFDLDSKVMRKVEMDNLLKHDRLCTSRIGQKGFRLFFYNLSAQIHSPISPSVIQQMFVTCSKLQITTHVNPADLSHR